MHLRALIERMRKIVLLLVHPDQRAHRVLGPAILSRAKGPLSLLDAYSGEDALAKAAGAPPGALVVLAPVEGGAPLLDALRAQRPDARPILYQHPFDADAVSRAVWDDAHARAADPSGGLSAPARDASAPAGPRPP